jgi:hypothetical protein
MTTVPTTNSGSDPASERPPTDGPLAEEGSTDPLAFASVALSAAGFLTLLKLADRRERTPLRALSLFLVTTFESVSGTVLGLKAVGRAQQDGTGLGRSFLLGAGGAVLGVVSTMLNVNWMRTRRRM